MKNTIAVLALTLLICFSLEAQTAAPLNLERTIVLTGVTGKFDHFGIDESGKRLFVSAAGIHAVAVIDLAAGKIAQSLTGMGKPHGLAWSAATGSLYVADGVPGELKVYRGAPLALAGSINLSEDTDDVVLDDAAQTLYVGHGGSDAANPARIAVIDTAKFKLAADIPVASHPEAVGLDGHGGRLFANIADANEVAVVNASTHAIAARWKLTGAADNVPLAYDDQHGMLYLACRKPGVLLALDGKSGVELARLPAATGADDLFYDASASRIYVIGGAGEVDAYQVGSDNKLSALGVTHTAAGAKTALFVASQNLLYVGIPGVEGQPAKIGVYATSHERVSH